MAGKATQQSGAGWHLIVVWVVTLALLAPFVNKAYHVDDTLFLYAARQIVKDPLHPYDFMLNWNGVEERMWDVTKNPPLASYCLAGISMCFGDGEVPAHASFLIFALMATGSVWWLARRTEASALWSGVLFAVCPAFAVTATGVSSDVAALAFFALAVAAFVHGSQENRWSLLVLAGVAAGLSSVSKYIGVTSIPLLAAYSLVRERGLSRRLLVLLISVAIFGAWAAHGWHFDGRPHFLTATSYGSEIQQGVSDSLSIVLKRCYYVIGTASFFGGGLGLVAFLAFPLAGRRWFPWVIALIATGSAVVLMAPVSAAFDLPARSFLNHALLAGMVFGATLFLASLVPGRTHWTGERVLLLLWLFGTLAFQGFLNWTVAIRIVMFAAPPAAVLLGQAIAAGKLRPWPATVAAVLTAILAFVIAASDARWADSYRSAARKVEVMATARGYFHAHWGLQYYLEKAGWRFITPDEVRPVMKLNRGELVLITPVALESGGFEDFVKREGRRGTFRLSEDWTVSALLGVHTQDRRVGAGLYSGADGIVPYAFSSLPCETFVLYEVQ